MNDEYLEHDGLLSGGRESSCDRSALRRERIIAVARKLFMKNGFHATGVAQLARESNIAVGQIYRDFDSKEDIVAAIVERDCADFMGPESLRAAIAIGDSNAVWDWIDNFICSPDRHESAPIFAEIVAEAARNERIAMIFLRTRSAIYNNMLAALALLVPGHSHAERREALADLVLTQSLGLSQHRLLYPQLDADRLAQRILSLVRQEVQAIAQMQDG